MSFLRNVGAAFVASCFVVSSASAVTVTFTHTATVAEVHDPSSALSLTPSGSQTIRVGDTMTLSYSLDSNAIKDPAISYGNLSAYGVQAANISFTSGFTSDLPGTYLSSWTGIDYSIAGNQTLTYELRGPAYLASTRVSRPGGPFSGTVAELADNVDILPVEYGKFSVDPVRIGLSATDCYSDYCFIGFSDWNSSVLVGDPKPLPPVSAVPVPAPFLMLGMAMLGLVGFGRRAQA